MKHDTCTSNSLGQAGPLKSDVARNVDAVFDPSPKMAPKNHDPLNVNTGTAGHEGEYKVNSGPLRK